MIKVLCSRRAARSPLSKSSHPSSRGAVRRGALGAVVTALAVAIPAAAVPITVVGGQLRNVANGTFVDQPLSYPLAVTFSAEQPPHTFATATLNFGDQGDDSVFDIGSSLYLNFQSGQASDAITLGTIEFTTPVAIQYALSGHLGFTSTGSPRCESGLSGAIYSYQAPFGYVVRRERIGDSQTRPSTDFSLTAPGDINVGMLSGVLPAGHYEFQYDLRCRRRSTDPVAVELAGGVTLRLSTNVPGPGAAAPLAWAVVMVGTRRRRGGRN
jgi:hypothetical protein